MTDSTIQVPLCCIVGCHNEEERLPQVLAHALCWADEILVVDKGSTDRTVEIARSFGEKVHVLQVPYAPQGDDDLVSWCRHIQADWVFGVTCSEIPTRKVIDRARELIADPGLDLIHVPRKFFSFGHHHATSPWSISYYPFLFNRHRVIIRNTIHDNIAAVNPGRTARIPYSDGYCVHHYTHPSATGFMGIVSSYARIESGQWNSAQIPAKLLHSFAQVRRAMPGILRCGEQAPMIMSAWCIYHFSLVLHGMERLQGGSCEARYAAARERMLAQEWGLDRSSTPDAVESPGAAALPIAGMALLLQATCLLLMLILVVRFPSYLLMFLGRVIRWLGKVPGRILRLRS